MNSNLLAFAGVGSIIAIVTALLSLVLPIHGALSLAVVGYIGVGLAALLR